MMRTLHTVVSAAVLLSAAPAFANPTVKPPAPGEKLIFETHVRPILKALCFECHGEGKKLKGGLDVRLVHLMHRGGDNGAAVQAGKPGESLLLDRIRRQEMPPGKRKMTADESAVLERWIREGAVAAKPEPKELPIGFTYSAEEASHWAYQPIVRPKLPSVKAKDRIRNPIDAFLLAKLEEKGLSYGPEADRATLIRRLSFDVRGVPPTSKEVDDFIADKSPDGYERLVDRLLATPEYSERWARHWLDVAGYADSEGFTGADPIRKTAFRYRDYVIKAIEADMPWDRFIQEQLAGDEMVRPPYEKLAPEELDKLIATGFLRLAADGSASPGVDVKAASNQTVADTMHIVSSSLFGLTIQCAQCHNHRYDPISQLDYYRMRAVFEPAFHTKAWRNPAGREVPIFQDADRKKADEIEREAAKIDQERTAKQNEYIEATVKKELAKLPAELHEPLRKARGTPMAKRTPEQTKLLQAHPSVNVSAGSLYLYDSKAAAELKKFADQAAKLRTTKPTPMFVRALTETPGTVPATHLFDRGDHDQPKEVVTPAGLTILEPLGVSKIPEKSPDVPTTGRRLAFAKSLTSGKHPLPPRTLMNRVWLNHFGAGIVRSPGDLGLLGERPTHPELLDWLAQEFVDGGWRMKRMHRLMLTSAAYRQSSARRPDLEKVDPDNRLLGRMSVRRLDAESLRDGVLAVSGKLNSKRFGPPVPVTHDEVGQVVIGNDIRNPGDGTPKGKVAGLGGEEFRRSIYVQVRRSLPLAMLETFDVATTVPNCEIRHASTVATQSLLMLNSAFIHEQAKFLSERLSKETTGGEDRVVRLWKLTFGSAPSAEERNRAHAFVAEQAKNFESQTPPLKTAEAADRAFANLCQAVISSNRFLYVD